MENNEQPLRLIRRLSNSIRREMQNAANFDFVERVTGANAWIINYLFENSSREICQKDIEAECNLSRSTVSTVLTLMESKGLIARVPSDADRRCKRLVLTQRAMEIHEMMVADVSATEKRMFRGFSEQEIETLISLIGRLRENLDQQLEKEEKKC